MVMLAIALGVAAIAVTVRWWTRRYDALGRGRSFPYVSIGLLTALALGAATPPFLRHREEDRLSAVASILVGSPVQVHCQSFGQTFYELGPELGYVRWGPGGIPEHQTFIKRGPCGDLNRYLDSNKHNPTPDEVIAVHVLTHESMHMRGITSESLAECAAMQRDTKTAELLGADPADALTLARTYWRADYPHMPDAYTSPDCRPGGPLDEHLPDPPWSPAA
jgi:hypothetical protein